MGKKIELYNAYITPAKHKEDTSTDLIISPLATVMSLLLGANYKEDTSTGGKETYPWIKLDLLAGLYSALAIPPDRLRILCGDFNTPQEETPNGEIFTWGYYKSKSTGRYSLPASGQDQHELECNILCGLGKYHDLPDVYRSVHGYANSGSDEAISYVKVRRDKHTKRRYDHVFASKALHPLSARYLQNMPTPSLSDHAPIEVVFELTNSIKSEALK